MNNHLSNGEIAEINRLYAQGWLDVEIAEVIRRNVATIRRFRASRGIKPNSCAGRMRIRNPKSSGIDYRKVLDPKQQLEARRFFNSLSHFGKIATKAGIKPDVNSFINAWRTFG